MNRAIVYIAYGKEYFDQALRSIESVDGQYPCVICTPNNYETEKAVIVKLPAREMKDWFLQRCAYFLYICVTLAMDYDQLLLLDADTYICGDLTDYFTILERFDIAGTQAISLQTKWRDDIPLSFPELHCGVLALKNTKQIWELFQRWFEIYQERPKYFGNDQPPLRQALWEMKDIKLGILPSEFCFRFRWGGLLRGKVRLLHGKEHNMPYEKIAEKVNKDAGDIRVFTRRELA